jgi:hypothetical protein
MPQNASAGKRPQIAVLANTYKTHVHTQHIVDRILDGYGYGAVFHHPTIEVVSIFVDQRGEGDLVPERAERHPEMKVYDTVAQALTRGTGKLAVDGVVYIGEHGAYPRNEKGQTEYPRYQMFEQTIDVFRASGHTAPYYNDKHLSWKWEWAKDMYDTSRKMGFPLMAGSSLPVTWRMPAVDMPLGANVREAVCVAYGNPDSYDVHALEAVQCFVERRKGGETGVEWLQAYRGEQFWKAYEEGVWSPALVKAALCRSQTLKSARESFTGVFPTVQQMKTLARDPVAYHYQYKDGLRSTIMLLGGLVEDFTFAASIEGQAKPLSTLMYLSHLTQRATLESYFNPLVHYIEQFMHTGKEPYPVERVLLATGLSCAGIDSLFEGQRRIETPHLAIRYQPGESTLRRT